MKSFEQDILYLVQFFETQGQNVVQTKSAYWCEIHPFCFQSLPFHLPVAPDPGEIELLFHKKFAVLVRYNSVENGDVIQGFNWVCDDRDYGLHSLEHRFRNRVSRGLKLTKVRPIDFQFLAKEGLDLIFQVAARQKRNPDFPNQGRWEKYCLAAAACPNFDAHGVFVDDRLAAFLVGAKIGDCYFSLLQASKTDYLSYCPNNALLFSIIKTKLQSPDIRVVSHGLSSVEHLDSLDRFKSGMGFRKEEINFKLKFNPYCKWMQNNIFVSSFDRLCGYFPKSNFIRKASALLRQMNQRNALASQMV